MTMIIEIHRWEGFCLRSKPAHGVVLAAGFFTIGFFRTRIGQRIARLESAVCAMPRFAEMAAGEG